MESPFQTSRPSFKTDFCLQLSYNVLLKEIEKGSNFVDSPLSLHVILSLIAAGSTGNTLKQLLSFLGSENIDDLNKSSSQIISGIKLVEQSKSVNSGPKLSFINGAWVEQSFGFKASYEEVVRNVYRSQVKEVDFINKADQLTAEVNSWVKNATNGLIKEILPSGSVDDKTKLILVNALYFKGAWSERFDASKTTTKNFNLLNEQIVQVPFMTSMKYEEHYYRSFDSFKVLRIPYQSGNNPLKLSMYFYLPHEKDGLQSLIHSLNSTPRFLNQDFRLVKEEIPDLWIPRFKFSFKFEGKDSMKELGLALPFSPGELTEMSDSPRRHKLYVSKMFHKAFIEVNEEGTEAAASTALIAKLQRQKLHIPSFVADHPFMFMIREETSMAVFFVGEVLNPLSTS
ncbi:hypothetical protein L6164_006610 [Bauhinia variegata]|uniref:Uncharacterized protein n=1 Tax=Bauhinia variegata TaxID=167791 RepID=A0ACB9PUE5_BAUVA|nr:hypothetical protein L6164_006610 [Bauhinia variegata]